MKVFDFESLHMLSSVDIMLQQLYDFLTNFVPSVLCILVRDHPLAAGLDQIMHSLVFVYLQTVEIPTSCFCACCCSKEVFGIIMTLC